MKKTLACFLALVMALSLAAASLAEGLPIVPEVIEYTIVVPDETYIEPLKENTVTQWILDNMNIKINWEEYPNATASEFKEKVNLIIAADELPDAFMYASFTPAELANYGGQGIFIPLNDLIEEYGVNHKKLFDRYEALPGAYTALDGNIYNIAATNECYHCFYALKAWINQTWLDNLGLEYPNTLEEFESVLTAFKEEDANGNGDPNDEIPMSGCYNSWNAKAFPFLMNSFLHFEDDKYLSVTRDGEVIFAPTQPEFKDGMQYIAGPIEKGLIEKESLTQTDEELKVKNSNGPDPTVGVVTGGTWWISMEAGSPGQEDLRARQYVALSPLAGPNGVRISPKMSGDGYLIGHTVITSACKDPVPLFKMFDYLLGDLDMTIRINMGVEGEDWTKPGEGEVGINGKPALYKRINQPEGALNFNWMDNVWPSDRNSDYRLGEWADYSDPDTKWMSEPRLYNDTHDFFAPFGTDYESRFPEVNMTTEEAERNAFLKTQINDYTKEQIVAFLAGERSFDEWDAFINEYNNLGLPEYMELQNTAYTRQYK